MTVAAVFYLTERALAFELLQFGDVLKSVAMELMPNRLCDYLKEVAVKGTDFVTKCHVLNAQEECGVTTTALEVVTSSPAPEANRLVKSRLLLCEATRAVMAKCFDLLGIDTLDRI